MESNGEVHKLNDLELDSSNEADKQIDSLLAKIRLTKTRPWKELIAEHKIPMLENWKRTVARIRKETGYFKDLEEIMDLSFLLSHPEPVINYEGIRVEFSGNDGSGEADQARKRVFVHTDPWKPIDIWLDLANHGGMEGCGVQTTFHELLHIEQRMSGLGGVFGKLLSGGNTYEPELQEAQAFRYYDLRPEIFNPNSVARYIVNVHGSIYPHFDSARVIAGVAIVDKLKVLGMGVKELSVLLSKKHYWDRNKSSYSDLDNLIEKRMYYSGVTPKDLGKKLDHQKKMMKIDRLSTILIVREELDAAIPRFEGEWKFEKINLGGNLENTIK